MGSEKEIAIIPKGTSVRIMGCAYTLLEDVKVDGNQRILNETLKAQSEFEGKPKTSGTSGKWMA
ncbi:hypothetical protein [Acinetobacter sp. SA01]|uniref:hypothetical protein n=1 Tax=Acinetobacter sp. SA01 TaxID=1862567 RepID=UPI00140CCD6A|nr:hypothetical protein [Acinetobacter sp. SA01]